MNKAFASLSAQSIKGEPFTLRLSVLFSLLRVKWTMVLDLALITCLHNFLFWVVYKFQSPFRKVKRFALYCFSLIGWIVPYYILKNVVYRYLYKPVGTL